MASIKLRAGNLVARIGDNEPAGAHRAGYNGVWSLRTKSDQANLFVPSYAGLNFEHIFDGSVWDPELLFEPRRAPMILRRVGENEVELHQPPTPFWGLESWTRFKLVAPHFLDLHFRCVPRQRTYQLGYIGLFWASYLNAPENNSLYFWGRPAPREPRRWIQFCTQHHNDESTVVRERETKPALTVRAPPRPWLFLNHSRLRYAEPLMFGRWKNQVLAVMFDRASGIRFAHSPSGGGRTPDQRDTNPAWDWQFIIPRYELNKSYGFQARTVFKRFAGREELRRLFRQWRAA